VSDKKRPLPEVQVVVRPGAPGLTVRPRTAPAPAPAQVQVQVRPAAPAGPSPSGPSPSPGRAPGPRLATRPGPGPRPAPRAGPPRPPPTEEQLQALARTERVPVRIARGALEGRMPCKIWRKLHAEEARRFDEAYALLARHPELGLQEAFGLAQAGIPLEEWKARRDKAGRKQAVKSARAQVANDAVAAWFAESVSAGMLLAVVEAEQTRTDTLLAEAPVELTFAQGGRAEKLRLLALGPAAAWEALQPALGREEALAARPAPLQRQPDKRPVSDARPFLDHAGKRLQLLLRNGLRLELPLAAVGPFDLLLQVGEHRLLVPLHALVGWAGEGAPPPQAPAR